MGARKPSANPSLNEPARRRLVGRARLSIRHLGNDDIEKTYIMTRAGKQLVHQVLTLSYYPRELFEDAFAEHNFHLRPFSPGDRYLVARGAQGKD